MGGIKDKAHKTLGKPIKEGKMDLFRGTDKANIDAKMIPKRYRPGKSDRTL